MSLIPIGVAVITWRVLMAVAVFGTITSTVFLGLVVVAANRHRRVSAKAQASVDAVDDANLPFAAILKPVHGLEPRLEQDLESFFLQDYPDFEIVFGARTSQDPAIAIVEKLCRRYPHVRTKIVYSGHPEWPNAKVFSLDKMIGSTTSDFLAISDSDVYVAPNFLRNVIVPLLDRKNGLVTSLYRGVPAHDFWSEVEAIGMSVEMSSGVMIADMLEGMKFALGAVMVARRDALEEIGGIRATAEYYSDDFVLGNLIAASGYTVVLSHHKVWHVLMDSSLKKSFSTQLRWATSTRYSRPNGHIGEALTYATPYGILGLIAGIGMGWPWMGAALLGWSLVNRLIQSLIVGWGTVRDPQAIRKPWLYPIRDLMGFCVWAGSFLGGSKFQWRGETYRFTRGGRIVSAARSVKAAEVGVASK